MGFFPDRNFSRGRRLLVLVWLMGLAIATYFSLLPGSRLGTMPGSDKLWHGFGYLLLAVPIPILSARRGWLVSAGMGLALYGIALEFGQELVPGRSYEVADMIANSAGVLSGVVMGWRVRGMEMAARLFREAPESQRL